MMDPVPLTLLFPHQNTRRNYAEELCMAGERVPKGRWGCISQTSQCPQVGGDSTHERISNKYHSRIAFLYTGRSHICLNFLPKR